MSFSAREFIHAGGALGLFVLIFLVNPPELIAPSSLQQPAKEVELKKDGSG